MEAKGQVTIIETMDGKDSVPSSVAKYAASAYNARTAVGNTRLSGCPNDIEDLSVYQGWTYKSESGWGGWADSAAVTAARPYLWMMTVPLNEKGGLSASPSYACLTGADGEKGADGRDALRNVLAGSDLRNKDMPELVVNSNGEGENIVEVSDTELCYGTRSLHVKVGNSDHYPGMFFSPVAIKRNTTYHLSVMAKGRGTLDFEVVNKLSAASRGFDRDGWLSPQPARASIGSAGWTLHERTFTTDSAHDYVEVNLHGNVKGDEFWLARPMLEEGSAYTGWTLNADDLRGEKGDPGGKGDPGAPAVTYEIDPITEQAAVSVEKPADTSGKIQVSGSLSVER